MHVMIPLVSLWSYWENGPAQASLTCSATPEGTHNPDLARGLKASWRRRLNLFARAAAQGIGSALNTAEQPYVIFASRHGDLHRTVALLDQIATDDRLSPTDFSMAVHNATAGITSINYGITQAHTAISAGIDTLVAALTEAACHLASDPQTPVIVAYVDLPLPEVFSAFDTPGMHGMALTFRLAISPPDQGDAPIALLPLDTRSQAPCLFQQAEFLAAFLQDPMQKQCDIIGRGISWRLARNV